MKIRDFPHLFGYPYYLRWVSFFPGMVEPEEEKTKIILD